MICLVVVAFANLLKGYTLVCTDRLTSRLLKAGYIKTSISGFQLLTLILQPSSAGVAEQGIHVGLRMGGHCTATL